MPDLYTVTATCDIHFPAADALARTTETATAYADVTEMLDNCNVDVAAVLTPLHYEIALECIDAGCDLFIEKPLCVTPSEAVGLATRIRETGRVAAVGTMRRYDSGVAAARRMLPSLGPIRWVELFDSCGPGLSSDPLPRLEEPVLQRQLADVGVDSPRLRNVLQTGLLEFVHDLALLRELFDCSLTVRDASAAADGWSLTGRLALDEIPCVFAVAEYGLVQAEMFRVEVRVIGERGAVALSFTDAQARPPQSHVELRVNREVRATTVTCDAYAEEWRELYRAIRTRTSPHGGSSDAADDVGLLWEIGRMVGA